MKIGVLGLQGSGKDTTVNALSEETGLRKAHIDDIVLGKMQEQYPRCKSIPDYVNTHCSGDTRPFRDIEHTVTGEVLTDPDIDLISFGGGTPSFDRNRHIIDPVDNYLLSHNSWPEAHQHITENIFNRERYPQICFRILLDISVDEQKRRLETKNAGGNENRLALPLQETYNERIPNFRNFANLIIEVDGKTVREIMDEIFRNTEVQKILKKAA